MFRLYKNCCERAAKCFGACEWCPTCLCGTRCKLDKGQKGAEIKAEMKRQKEMVKRIYCSRFNWFWLLTIAGLAATAGLANVASGFGTASPSQVLGCVCSNDNSYSEGASCSQPPQCASSGANENLYMAVFPDTSTWKAPIILSYIGLVIGLFQEPILAYVKRAHILA